MYSALSAVLHVTCSRSSKKFQGFIAWHQHQLLNVACSFEKCTEIHLGTKHRARCYAWVLRKKEITSTRVIIERARTNSLVLADFEMYKSPPSGMNDHILYIDSFSHEFKKYSLNMYSVPRIAVGSGNWDILFCTIENQRPKIKTWGAGPLLVSFTKPTSRIRIWLPQLSEYGCISFLLYLAVATYCCDPQTHTLGFQPQCPFVLFGSLELLSLITLKDKASGVKWITIVWRCAREWASNLVHSTLTRSLLKFWTRRKIQRALESIPQTLRNVLPVSSFYELGIALCGTHFYTLCRIQRRLNRALVALNT